MTGGPQKQRQYPEGKVELPYWKGISEIRGPHGEFLYGTYQRSKNIAVASATSLRKRRGFQRALDERFWGAATGTFLREGQTRYTCIVDGEGVKVFNTLVPKANDGVTLDHPGFPIDTFDRADDTNISLATNPQTFWSEGSISASGEDKGEEWEIASNDLTLRTAAASAVEGALDHVFFAPTPFYTERIELDLSDLHPTTNGGDTELMLFHGMHDVLIAGGAQIGNPGNATDAAARLSEVWAYGPRTGFVALIRWNQLTTSDAVRMQVFLIKFLSDHQTGIIPTNTDGVFGGWALKQVVATHEFATIGDLQGTHVLEMGSAVTAAAGQWVNKVRFWADTTLATLTNAPGTANTFSMEETVRLDSTEQFRGGLPGYNVLPWGATAGVRFGMYGSVTGAGTTLTNELRISEIDCGLRFFA